MKIIGIIPARYASSRFPGKPLASILGKPMIQWVYEGASQCEALSAVYVATDDERIFHTVESFGGNALMTSGKHECGTDRLAECAQKLALSDEDIIVNVQGDEPLVKAKMISELLSAFREENVYMATLKKRVTDKSEAENPNVVKVVSDCNGDALYFSRSMIPFSRDGSFPSIYKHIGMYAYKSWFLKKITCLEKTLCERVEMLEQLRILENGYKIRCEETDCVTVSVDNPSDIAHVEEIMRGGGTVVE